MTDHRWEVALLEELGPALAYPPTPDLAGRVLASVERPAPRHPGTKKWRAAGLALSALVLVAALVALASRDARDAVAGFLGLGVAGERIEVAPTPRPGETTLPSPQPLARYGERVSRRDAVTLAGFEPRLPASLGEPRGFYVLLDGPTVIVADYEEIQVWEFPLGTALIGKMIGVDGGAVVSTVRVNGADGYWISGGKRVVAVLDPQGTPIARTQRTTGSNALVWAAGGLYRRIEGAETLEDALSIAAEMP